MEISELKNKIAEVKVNITGSGTGLYCVPSDMM